MKNGKYYKKNNRNKNDKRELWSACIPLIAITLFIFLFDGKGRLLKFILLIDIAVILLVLFDFWLKCFIKRQKHKRYLKSSLYQIDRMDGRVFEEYLAAHFKNQGYKVEFTPVSNDYGADLILQKGGERVAVQAKRYNAKVGNSAVQEVSGAMMYYKCTSGMVITNSFYTKNAMQLAKECNIVLWDRETLKKEFKTG